MTFQGRFYKVDRCCFLPNYWHACQQSMCNVVDFYSINSCITCVHPFEGCSYFVKSQGKLIHITFQKCLQGLKHLNKKLSIKNSKRILDPTWKYRNLILALLAWLALYHHHCQLKLWSGGGFQLFRHAQVWGSNMAASSCTLHVHQNISKTCTRNI